MLLLFDLDGVLIDCKKIHEYSFIEGWNEIVSTFKIDEIFHMKYLDGRNTYSKIDYLQHLYNIPYVDKHKIFDKKQDLTIDALELFKYSTRLRSIFIRLKQEGYLLGCVSNSIRKTINIILKKNNIIDLFDLILSNEDVKFPKPSPELYIKAMNILNVNKMDTYIFEDSIIGLKAANESGANTIHIQDSKDLHYSFIKKSILYKMRYRPWFDNPNWKLRVVIPMAGDGTRFKNAGYTVTKPLININNIPMIKWVINNITSLNEELQSRIEYHICVRQEWVEALKDINNIIIHPIEKLTEGPACTVLTVQNIINKDTNPLLIVNSDQFLEWSFDDFIDACINPEWDGCISTFYQPDKNDTKWSFADVNADGYVTNVAEKKYISSNATTGLYYWKNGSDFIKFSNDMIVENNRVNNEFYVGPVYNYAINSGHKIRIFECKKMWGLGTPSDLDTFKKKYLNINE